MAIDFPNSPTLNQQFTVGDRVWTWDGTRWESVYSPIELAAPPLSYDPVTRSISIDLSDYYTSEETDLAIATAINSLIDSAPSALNTLNELAAALADDADFAGTITNQIGAIEQNIDIIETNLQSVDPYPQVFLMMGA